MRCWLALLVFTPALAQATPLVGLELGVGRLDERFRLHVQPDLILQSEDFHLHLAAPIELFPGDFSLRQQDWDEAGDYTAILQQLLWKSGRLRIEGGKLHLSAGAETVVQRHPVGHHPNRPGSAFLLEHGGDRWRGQLGVTHDFAMASFGYSLWKPQAQQPVQPELAVVLAGTQTSPLLPGVDGRLAVDLTLPYHGRGYALAGYTSGIVGLGSHQETQWRVHGGLRGEHHLAPHWLRWRAELRHSPTGLMAQPFDAAMGLLDPEADTIAVRKEAMAGLGFAGRLEWSDRFRFAFAQDPEVQRLEAVISVHRDKTGRFYLGCGWVSFAGLDNWPFLLGEVRWRLQKGATAFARARALERSINGGGQRLVSDGMLGISWALALRRGN